MADNHIVINDSNQPDRSNIVADKVVKTTTISSQSSLEQFEEHTENLVPTKPPRLRLCESICVRLLSEMHRILLCHNEHSMMLEELCESFKDTEEPSQPTSTDLIGAIETYAGKKSQYKFNVSLNLYTLHSNYYTHVYRTSSLLILHVHVHNEDTLMHQLVSLVPHTDLQELENSNN